MLPTAADDVRLQLDCTIRFAQSTALYFELDVNATVQSLSIVGGRCGNTLSVAASLVVSGELDVGRNSSFTVLLLQPGMTVTAGSLAVKSSLIAGTGTIIVGSQKASIESSLLAPGYKGACDLCAASCNWGFPRTNLLGDIKFVAPRVSLLSSDAYISFLDPVMNKGFLETPNDRVNVTYDTISFSDVVVFDDNLSRVLLYYNNATDIEQNGKFILWGQAFGASGVTVTSIGRLKSYSVTGICVPREQNSGTGPLDPVVPTTTCASTGLSVILSGTCPPSNLALTSSGAGLISTSGSGSSTSPGTTTGAPSSGLSTGAIVGIAVGGAVGLGILIALAIGIPQMISSYQTKRDLKVMQKKITSTIDL